MAQATCAAFLWGRKVTDTIVYVDGFNLYHAIDELRQDSLKWLCLRQLAESILRPDENLKMVKYFSAYAAAIGAAA